MHCKCIFSCLKSLIFRHLKAAKKISKIPWIFWSASLILQYIIY
nr:MAG TPA: hypothetical protein [Caudoviricetes sp.]